jgi:hypothetical protein
MIDVASKIELTCGCGANYTLSGLLASSDVTGAISNWATQGHVHEHGSEPKVLETKKIAKKKADE